MEKQTEDFIPNEEVSTEDLLKNSIEAVEEQIEAVIGSDEINDADKKERVANLRRTISDLQKRVARERTSPNTKGKK